MKKKIYLTEFIILLVLLILELIFSIYEWPTVQGALFPSKKFESTYIPSILITDLLFLSLYILLVPIINSFLINKKSSNKVNLIITIIIVVIEVIFIILDYTGLIHILNDDAFLPLHLFLILFNLIYLSIISFVFKLKENN